MKISESKILFWLALPRISAVSQAKVLKAFQNSPIELWQNFEKRQIEITAIVGKENYAELKRCKSLDYIDMQLDRLRQDGISVITMLNPRFPKQLLQPEVGAPTVLYYRGSLEALDNPCVAIVGTRAATAYGKECAKTIASQLVKAGVTVVSGLATGIDYYAHEAALDAGGRTIAVLASGLNKVTPVGNTKLYERIVKEGGLVLSEYKPDAGAYKFTFPERNRIVSGLSKGVVVVEAGEKSGALITASLALEQNREVFAVPGNVTSTRSVGSNNLLYQGANFVRNGYDVLTQLKIKPIKKETKGVILVDKVQKKLYSFLESAPTSLDKLIELSGLDVAEASEALLLMEMDGLVYQQSAGLYAIKSSK